MSLLGILRYLNGYVEISVKGDCSEQFINLCSKQKIMVWNIRKELGILKMRISVKDFKKIRQIRRNSRLKLKIKIIKKCGIRFKLYKHRKRKGLLLGALIFFAFLIYMSNFVWTIKIEGNKVLTDEKVLKVCSELGVSEGVKKGEIDTYNLPPKLILKLEEVAWCSFNIEGTKLTIQISESKVSDKEKLTAANIVASRDGVIEKLEITDGVKMVKIGQAVRKGDLIASGLIDNGVRTYTVKADGMVVAKTERSFSYKIPKKHEIKVPTGQKKNLSVVNFFGIKIPLYFGKINFKYIDSFYERKAILFNEEIPISISSRTFKRVETEIVEENEKTAKNKALELVSAEAKLLDLHSIKIKEIICEETETEYICRVETECREDICEFKEINIDN